ncbi:Chaperone protein dnaJ 8, chloroplastic [Linum perenne]
MFSAASYSSSVMDPYKTLRIQPSATESEVRKAFWKLALQMFARGSTVEDDWIYDADYDLWEEWMGWEGGQWDYASHVSPYIPNRIFFFFLFLFFFSFKGKDDKWV